MASPCSICDFKDEDKNLARHVNCEKRLTYAVAQGMLPKEVLEQKEEDALIKEAREKVVPKKLGRPVGSIKKKKACSEEGCDYRVWAKGKCRSHYSKDYRESKVRFLGSQKEDVVVKNGKKGPKKRHTIHLLFPPKYEDIYFELKRIAHLECRKIGRQAVFFIKQGIKDYNKGNRDGGRQDTKKENFSKS